MDRSAYHIIILAAGSSERLGRPKQLLQYQGKSLLQHAIDKALASIADRVVVVLGAYAERIRESVKGREAVFIENPGYTKGMASGIALGTAYLLNNTGREIGGILIMLCDQPFVTSEHLDHLFKKQKTTGAPVVASYYRARKGVPAVFHRDLFPELIKLEGEHGARDLMRKYETETIGFPGGAVDVDTLEDYRRLTKIIM
ncbi:nucleotidyltransferase family protein [Sinomicrobium oceani]|uniref:nucleotidyltransferase family protein n=1 Tax=Sinomicrobium oceani TaxID=1150368 RepID=UPI00227BDAB2|nr:nucleotidyltransferase family protein [Sinomicrobium oceani]